MLWQTCSLDGAMPTLRIHRNVVQRLRNNPLKQYQQFLKEKKVHIAEGTPSWVAGNSVRTIEDDLSALAEDELRELVIADQPEDYIRAFEYLVQNDCVCEAEESNLEIVKEPLEPPTEEQRVIDAAEQVSGTARLRTFKS